jgi:dUTP pyrophosphatase
VIEVAVLRLDDGLPVPSYARMGDAGADLVARSAVTIPPSGGRAVVPTGIALAIPDGFAGLVQPRSGLAAHHGVTCLNAPGLIDAGYRGEIAVVLVNTDPTAEYRVNRGDRIAQLVIYPIATAHFVVATSLPDTERAEGGFGHTGR